MLVTGSSPPAPLERQEQMWAVAKKLEASFLAEMLKSTGLGDAKSQFSGGTGEAQWASFLREAQAQNMVDAGGLGLAETFFHAMKEMEDGRQKG